MNDDETLEGRSLLAPTPEPTSLTAVESRTDIQPDISADIQPAPKPSMRRADAKPYVPKEPKKMGRRKGSFQVNEKTGERYRQSQLRRDADKKRKRDERAAERAEREALASSGWDDSKPLKEEAARERVKDAADNTRIPNVVDQCYRFGVLNAHDAGLTANEYLWTNGPRSALSCSKGEQPEPEIDLSDITLSGAEVLTVRELHTLYSFCTAGRTILDQDRSFSEWLGLRTQARTDLYWFEKQVLRIPLVEEVHRVITEDFYPKFNVVYPPNYNMDDVHTLMAQVTDQREFLLLDPRGYMKTSMASGFVLQFFLNFPDARVMDTSGTDDLALGFIRIMKTYLGLQSGSEPSTFSLLFPEYTLWDVNTEGQTPFVLPCRKYAQKDFSLWTAGVMAASSGAHCDLWLQDDTVQEPGSETTRKSLLNKLANLGNVPDNHAMRIAIGTRYHEDDAYSHKISLLEEDPNAITFMCRGEWTVKPGFGDVEIENLTLDMINLSWPNHSGSPEKTFKHLKRKLLFNKADFMHQQMNEPWDENEGKGTFAFDESVLRAHILPSSNFPINGEIFQVVDVAYTNNPVVADYSVVLVGRAAINPVNKKLSLYILHVDAKRRTQTNLAIDLAQAAIMHRPSKIGSAQEFVKVCNWRGFQNPGASGF